MRRLVGSAVLLALAACGGCDTVPSNAVTNCQAIGIASAKTDILFVVDDSASMETKQQILASNIAGFIANLASLPVANDYQIGVTTTSITQLVSPGTFSTTFSQPCGSGTTIICDPAPNGGLPYPAGALVNVTGGSSVCSRKQSTTATPRVLLAGSPTLVADFTQNSYVGICGSGEEQGLWAAQLAVSSRIDDGSNAGFLRPGARLVLVIISDDDDCSDPLGQGTSVEPPGCTSYSVDNFIAFFKGPIAGEQRDVLVAGIISVDPATLIPAACSVQDPTTCTPTTTTAEHAGPRYKQFVDAFGPNGVVDSVCNCTFENSLTKIATLIGQEVPLSAEAADWRLLSVSVTKPGGTSIACTLGLAGAGGTPDVLYTPPTATRPAMLTFGGAGVSGTCALQAGDQIEVKILCAG